MPDQSVDDLPVSLLLEGVPSALIAVGEAGDVRFVNSVALEVLACKVPLGSQIEESVATIETLLEIGENSASGEMHNERGIAPACNPSLELGLRVNSIQTAHGRLYLIVFRNISKAVQLRQERDRLLRMATISEIMPTILHELKNPLAAIITSQELLIEDLGESELAKQIHAILCESRRLKLTLDGIGVAGHALRCRRYAAVDQVCRDSFALMSGKAKNVGVVLTAEISDLPALPFSPAVIRAIVFNLVSNAIAACGVGGDVGISVFLDDEIGEFVLIVKDTGKGMSPDELEKSTELFYSTKRSGSGIGLALCKRFAEQAGGQLSIASTVGVGTHIAIRIPTQKLPSENHQHK